MDYVLLIVGFFFMIGGVLGSFLPVIPGPPTSWLGLLCLHLTNKIQADWTFLWITLAIAIIITIADYIIPAIGTKKFGGSKYGVWGSTIGLIVGLIFTPVGMILGLFLGALIGELIYDSRDFKKALKASLGSVLGFFLSTGIKLALGLVYFYFYLATAWEHKESFVTW